MIFNHESPAFQEIWNKDTKRRKRNKYNGAYYYSKEICELMIPRIETDRNWFTVHVQGIMKNHSIVFIHEMFEYERYNDLKDYNDLVLVISHLHQYEHVKDLGKVIWLPMSVDTKYLEQFKAPKTKDVAYIGRSDKLKGLTASNSQHVFRSVAVDSTTGAYRWYAMAEQVGAKQLMKGARK